MTTRDSKESVFLPVARLPLERLIEQAREATTVLRDAAREGRRIDFRERDPLVMAIHNALDALAACLGAPPVVQCEICHYIDGVKDSAATICAYHYGLAVQGESEAQNELRDLRACLGALQEPLDRFFEKLAKAQVELPEDAAKILREHLWELYESEPSAAVLPPSPQEGLLPQDFTNRCVNHPTASHELHCCTCLSESDEADESETTSQVKPPVNETLASFRGLRGRFEELQLVVPTFAEEFDALLEDPQASPIPRPVVPPETQKPEDLEARVDRQPGTDRDRTAATDKGHS